MSQQVVDFLSRPEVMAVGLGLAAFLALFWAIRGAPIGQSAHDEPSGAPGTGYRDRTVALAVLAFLVVLAGALVVDRWGIPWAIPVFGAGFGMILWVIRANAKYRHVSPTLRRVVAFSNTAMTASLIGGILIIGNVFAFRYGGRPLDFTRDRAFTLSEPSVKVARELEKPTRFTLVLGRSPRGARLRDRIRQLVDLYHAANPEKIAVEEVVAYSQAQASAYDALTKRVPELGVIQGDGLLIEYGAGESGQRVVLGLAEMFREPNPQTDGASFTTSFNGEESITSVLVRLREGKRSRVGFTRGHGEPSISEMDPRQLGLGLWRSRLAALGTDAVEVDLIAGDIPPDVGLLIVAAPAPRSPFQPQEVERIRAFLTRGGAILLLANTVDGTGLEPIAALHNIAFDPGVVVDPVLNLTQRSNLVVTPPIGRGVHPILDPMVGMRVLLPGASPSHVTGAVVPQKGAPKPSVNPGIVNVPFLRTSATSWAETNISGGRVEFDPATDRRGPLIVGIAATERPGLTGEATPRPRMVAISSGQMATNPALDMFPDNVDLLMNAVQWLRGRSESVGSVPAKVYTPMPFTADAKLRQRLHLVPTIYATIVILGVGFVTWLARRA